MNSTATPGMCPPMSGLYSYVFTNGWTNDPPNCPLPQNLETVIGPAAVTVTTSTPCVATTTGTTCSASIEEQCPTTIAGFPGTDVTIATLDANADASVVKGHVTESATYDMGQGSCDAHWDFTATRTHQ